MISQRIVLKGAQETAMVFQVIVIDLQLFIDGLQLRHRFFPPKRLDVKTPLQSSGRYRKSMYNSLSGDI